MIDAEEIIMTDRERTEKIVHKNKTNQLLTPDESAIFRAEVQRILRETPDDEPLPIVYGEKFLPLEYQTANPMIVKLMKQGQDEKHPLIIDKEKLKDTALDYARTNTTAISVPYGARAFEIIDMRDVFVEDHELDVFFDCYFLSTSKNTPYRAWFHRDYNGIVRYYSSSPYERMDRWAFDAIDLYGMTFGKTDMLDHEQNKYLRHYAYKLIRKEQKLVFDSTVTLELKRLNKVKEEIQKRHDSKKAGHTDDTVYSVLMTFVNEALARTFQHGQYNDKGKAVFFMSTNELVKRVKEDYSNNELVKKSKVTLNNAINLLAALGFIQKLNNEQLSKTISGDKLIRIRQEHARNGRNQINYFLINDVPSEYWVRKQLSKLDKKDITLHKVTKRAFNRAFGPELTDEVFSIEDVTVKKMKYEIERKEYTRAFLLAIRGKGFVTKEELTGILPTKSVENKLWTELISSMRGQIIRRTTKAIRSTFEVETKGSIFISHAVLHPSQPVSLGMKDEEEKQKELLLQEFNRLIDEVLYWYRDIYGNRKIRLRNAEESNNPEEAYTNVIVDVSNVSNVSC